MSVTSGDKFMDGTETFKFSPKSTPETARYVDGITNEFEALKQTEQNHYNELHAACEQNEYNISEAKSITQRCYDRLERFEPTVAYSTYFIAPVLMKILCSWPARLLNWFFHWYSIQIMTLLVNVLDPENIKSSQYIVLTVDYDVKSWDDYHHEYKVGRRTMKSLGLKWKQLVENSVEMMRQTEIRIQ